MSEPKVTFVNGVLGGGTFNNVVNLQLGVCLFDQVDEKGQVGLNMQPAAYLRMDMLCARAIRDWLDKLLPEQETDAQPVTNGLGAAEEAPAASQEASTEPPKLN